MAPLLHPRHLLVAGVLAGAMSLLPAAATFKRGKSRSTVFTRIAPAAPPPAPVPIPIELVETTSDALFYDIPPRTPDPTILQNKCDSAATAENTPEKTAVDFSGYVAWHTTQLPEELPSLTFLTIELQDASGNGKVEDRAVLYIHSQEISDDYQKGEPVQFTFCAKVPEVEEYGLYARVAPAPAQSDPNSASSQLNFAGLTDIEAGLKEYKDVRVRLFKARPHDAAMQAAADKDDIAADEAEDNANEKMLSDDGQAPGNAATVSPPSPAQVTPSPVDSPAVASAAAGEEMCKFGDLAPDVRGVAARVIMEVPPPLANATHLPKPTILTVLLEELNALAHDGQASEPLAVFSSDITQWYRPGEDLTAMLCAHIPAHTEKAAIPYKLRSLLNIGWNGYDESIADDPEINPTKEIEPLQKLRSGDYTAVATVTVVPDKNSYVVQTPLVPYDS